MVVNLIGICGYKGAGKSTVCEVAINLERPERPFVRHGFADPMYKMLHAMGIPEEIVYDKTRWDEPLDILCSKTMRHACQTLGIEWGRECIGMSVWSNAAIRRAERSIEAGQTVVIDNVRMPDDFEAIVSRGGIVIAFHRPTLEAPAETHDSERHIETIQKLCTWKFHNPGIHLDATARSFRRMLDKIVET